MYPVFFDPYGLYRSTTSVYPNEMNISYQPQEWVLDYADQLLEEESQEDHPSESMARQRDEVEEILEIFLTRRQDVLTLIEAYGVPRRISRTMTRRIIRFVLNNANQVSGNLQQRTERLFRQFMAQDRVIVPALRAFRVPENVISQYVREVIRVTLRNMDIEPGPDTNANIRRILREFEEQYPNFLGLTNNYNLPVNVARNITRNIIEFTLTNLNRIPQVGTIQQRANAMLRLLDREEPQLIERMIRRGVPAVQAENIARRIIVFTLGQVPLPR